MTDQARALHLDSLDPLAAYRDLFVGASTPLVYFDGNSLGRPLIASVERLATFVAEEWGGRLIRGWDESWYDAPLTLGDELGRITLGAAPGQTMIGDSTTVLLYKLIRAGVDAQVARDPRRTEIVIDTDNFPTDRYIVEGIAAERGCRVVWIDVDTTLGVTPELLAAAVGEKTSVVVVSHVAYRSGYLADVAALTRITHDVGGLILVDSCHSAGSVETALDEWDVDLAVGCTYKYLNGGPGAPAFAYVAARLQDQLHQPIKGWMGHEDSFLMGPTWSPAAGMRFVSGTPPVLSMVPLRDMLALIDEVGMAAVREKSLGLTAYAVELADAWLAPLDVTVTTPREPALRGGHITLNHPRMSAVNASLWESDVLPDYRDPHGLRIGLSPLSTSYDEVWRGLAAVRDELS
jgi:kynureninase